MIMPHVASPEKVDGEVEAPRLAPIAVEATPEEQEEDRPQGPRKKVCKLFLWILILGGAALAVWLYPPLLKVAWRVGGLVCLLVGVVIYVIMGLLVVVLQLGAFLAIAQIGIRGYQGANMLVFFFFLCLSALSAIVSTVYDFIETDASSILPWMLGLQLLLGIMSIIFQGLFYGKKK